MLYNFTHVSSIAGCDAMIEEAQREKDILVLRRDNLTNAVNHSLAVKAFIQEDVVTKTNLITSLTELLATKTPDSSEWHDVRADLFDAEADRSKLLRRLSNPSTDRQYSLGQYEAAIIETDLYLAALESRKVELQNA